MIRFVVDAIICCWVYLLRGRRKEVEWNDPDRLLGPDLLYGRHQGLVWLFTSLYEVAYISYRKQSLYRISQQKE